MLSSPVLSPSPYTFFRPLSLLKVNNDLRAATYLSTLILSHWLKTCERAHPKARWKCPWLFSCLSGTLSASSLLLPWFIFSSDFPAPQAPLWLSIIDLCPHLAQDRWAGAGFPSPTANWRERFRSQTSPDSERAALAGAHPCQSCSS